MPTPLDLLSATGLPAIALHGTTNSWRPFEPVLPYLPPDVPATRCTGKNRSSLH